MIGSELHGFGKGTPHTLGQERRVFHQAQEHDAQHYPLTHMESAFEDLCFSGIVESVSASTSREGVLLCT